MQMRETGGDKLRAQVREMSRDEAIALLSRHHVGRVAISFHDRVRLKIADYLYSEGWIYARTELGADLTTVKHHPWAAFQVDEVEGIYDWRSVEITGAVQILSSDPNSSDWHQFEAAVELLRSAVPQVLTADDPMPQNVQVLRLHVDEIRGRESRSSGPAALPQP